MAENRVVVEIVARDEAFRAGLQQAGRNMRTFRGELKAVSREALVTSGALQTLAGALSGAAFVNTLRTLDGLRRSFEAITGSAEDAARELAFVRAIADRLGLDVLETARNYRRFLAAVQGTALQGEQAQRIFTTVAAALSRLGASTDQTSRALVAIEQIISKGNVSAEELRGQLGEALPGAFQIAARAIGVTTAELNKLLQTGSLTAEQLLPKLADELGRTFNVEGEVDSLNASIERLKNRITDLIQSAEQGGAGRSLITLFEAIGLGIDLVRVGAGRAGIETARLVETLRAAGQVGFGDDLPAYYERVAELSRIAEEQTRELADSVFGANDALAGAVTIEQQYQAALTKRQKLQAELATVQTEIAQRNQRAVLESAQRAYREEVQASEAKVRAIEQQELNLADRIIDLRQQLADQQRTAEERLIDARRRGQSEFIRGFQVQQELAQRLQEVQRQLQAAREAETEEARAAALAAAEGAQRRADTLAGQIDDEFRFKRALEQVSQSEQQITRTKIDLAEREKAAAAEAREAEVQRLESAQGLLDSVTAKLDELKDPKPIELRSNAEQIQSDLDTIGDKLRELSRGANIPLNLSPSGPTLPGFARGGSIPGYGGGDRVAAALEPGEYVLRKEAVRHYGLPFIQALNRLKANPPPRSGIRLPEIPKLGFQAGGLVQSAAARNRPTERIQLDINLNGKPARFTSDKESARRLVDALTRFASGYPAT